MSRGARAPSTDRIPASIRSLLDGRDTDPPPVSAGSAGTLIALRELRGEPHVLLIERAVRSGDPGSGQIALPGGRSEPSDANLLSTALREFEEEVGLSRTDLLGTPVFVGRRPAPVFGLEVAIFASAIRDGVDAPAGHNPAEVTSVFWMPRSTLGRSERVLRETSGGPIEVDATVHDRFVLWGFTRRVLLDFFGLT